MTPLHARSANARNMDRPPMEWPEPPRGCGKSCNPAHSMPRVSSSLWCRASTLPRVSSSLWCRASTLCLACHHLFGAARPLSTSHVISLVPRVHSMPTPHMSSSLGCRGRSQGQAGGGTKETTQPSPTLHLACHHLFGAAGPLFLTCHLFGAGGGRQAPARADQEGLLVRAPAAAVGRLRAAVGGCRRLRAAVGSCGRLRAAVGSLFCSSCRRPPLLQLYCCVGLLVQGSPVAAAVRPGRGAPHAAAAGPV